jgi:SEC-C motif-containing protein
MTHISAIVGASTAPSVRGHSPCERHGMPPCVAILDIHRSPFRRTFASLAPASHPTPQRAVTCAAAKGFGAAATKTLSKENACPCGSGEPYKSCCKPYHTGTADPPTAEATMRSRYSAYCKKLVGYVVATTHPDNAATHGTKEPDGTVSSTLEEDVRATCEKIRWDRLKVVSTEDGNTPDEAFVTFQVWFKVTKQIGQRQQGWHTQTFVERSRFLRDGESGRWLYVEGEQDWK